MDSDLVPSFDCSSGGGTEIVDREELDFPVQRVCCVGGKGEAEALPVKSRITF